jgi:lipid-binding SYLF domain-containing protein
MGNTPLMKTLTVGLLLLGFASSTFAVDKVQLDNRIRTLTGKFEELQSKPDKCVPADNLRKAQGILLLDRTKAGLVFGYHGGGGVALVKDAEGKWGPAGFMAANEGSFGVQIGGEQTFFAILLMSTNATHMLLEPKFELGGEARGTAGDSTAVEEGKSAAPERTVLVYDTRKGFYGGTAIKGGSVSPDDGANRVYYQEPLTLKEILFEKKVKPTDAATALAKKLTEYSKSPKK